ncbi:beta-lactamase family protein [Massilia solisilvae]|uniref:Beta-lactamase family protein n=1 Tax=Massilia solisilvae TaxID=1811225 RepID=A0ABT2BKT1_9BURK|nr:serine hydrolase domain-containing protein [Massilia solisilvae]MCS0608685.1 beta-lactamase family protein [Massilia solisilvae]
MRHARDLVIAGALLSCGSALAAPDRIDQYMRAQMERAHIPAAAVAVVRDGKIVKLASYGTADVEQGVPAGPHSAFQIASTTKLLTSTVLMQLVGEGRIELDAPVSRYIEDAPAEWSTMTLRHLVSHTSGLPRVAAPPELATPRAAVEYASKQKLAAAPGEVAAYGSVDFSIVAYIIEKVTGKKLEQLFAERLARPMRMEDTRFARFTFSPNKDIVQTELVPGRVTTYQWKDGAQYGYRYLYPAYTFAAGGAFSSVHDMAQFLRGIGSGKLLGASLLEQMWTPTQLMSGKNAPFAVGWTRADFRGLREVGHSGGPALADLRYYPEQKLGVIVLTNQRKLMPVLARGVAGMVLPAAPFLTEPGIADADPARTAAFRRAFAQFAEGRVDPALFGGELKSDLAELEGMLALQLGALPPLSKLVLLQTSSDNRQRTYRSLHGKDDSLRWVVRFDEAGLIADLDTVDE